MVPEKSYDWPLKKMARLPFLSDAKEYISEEGPPLDELINDRIWSMVRSRGKERILETIEEGRVTGKDLSDEVEMEMELFSYPLARMIVSCADDDYLVRRYSLGEAEKMKRELEKENDENLLVVAEELSMNVSYEDGMFKLFFGDYLENTERLRSGGWKLTNQDLRDGEVYLTKERLIRIMKEAIFSRISEDLPKDVPSSLVDKFSGQVKEVKQKLEESRGEIEDLDLGKVETELFPPCIKKMISLQKEGVNLSHEGRFALTAYLHKVGLSEDEILSMFKGSPDFDEELARYQIEHIIGDISSTEYSPPNCSTMKTNGVCYEPDSLCEQEWMKHPLTYYTFKKKKKSGGE